MIYIDFETRSKVDLKKSGTWVYSLDPSTEVLCMAFAKDNSEVRIWKPTDQINPESLKAFFENQLVEAHNVFFERAIWENIMVPKYGWPEIKPEQWRCSAALAAYHAIPRSLEDAGNALGLATVKDQSGKRVMMQLAKPRAKSGLFYDPSENADKFETLYEYCKQDVQAERAISEALGELPASELKIWQLDQKINHRGVPIDRDLVSTAIKMLDDYAEELTAEAIELTEGELKTIGQRAKVLAWCADQGEVIKDYTKTGVAEALKTVKNPKVKRLLEIRQALGKTSTAKYEAMLNSSSEDGRIRDTLMYHGAATGRWAGKKVQFQNLPRGSIKDMDTAVEAIRNGDRGLIEMLYGNFMPFMSSAIRGMVKASEGNLLVVADFAAIEARVLGWLAGSELMLQQFRDGVDLYKEMASKIYKVSVEEVTSEQRQLGKAAILGAGYGMGHAKFLDTCLSWGITIDEELARLAIATYRETYPEVPAFWRNSENGATNAVRYATPDNRFGSGLAHWGINGGFLKCTLPSGRALHYYKPEIKDKETPFGMRPALTFMGEKQGKTGGKTWMRVDTYGGKLVENITQAVARDLMAEAMLRIEDAGFEIVMSVHDELVAEVSADKADLKKFESLMAQVPSWAKGCPVEATGWVGKHYRK